MRATITHGELARLRALNALVAALSEAAKEGVGEAIELLGIEPSDAPDMILHVEGWMHGGLSEERALRQLGIEVEHPSAWPSAESGRGT